jgi:hypothetical protein
LTKIYFFSEAAEDTEEFKACQPFLDQTTPLTEGEKKLIFVQVTSFPDKIFVEESLLTSKIWSFFGFGSTVEAA